jgi:hypothetical protein
MSHALDPNKRFFRVRPSAIPRPNTTEITSLEDIPEFDDAEAEIRFWRSHTVSKTVLDQIPEPEPEE